MYKFVIGADDHYGENYGNLNGEMTQAYVDSLKQEDGLRRFFQIGDIAFQQNYYAAYQHLKYMYDSVGVPYNVGGGNHDNQDIMYPVFGITTLDQVITDGEFIWIMLDSQLVEPFTDAQMNLVRTTLIDNPDKLVFILMHVSHKNLAFTGTYSALEIEDTRFIDLVTQHKNHIGLIACGHAHHFNAFVYNLDGLRWAYSGTIGSNYPELNPTGYFSYRVVEVERGLNDWKVHIYRKNILTGEVVPETEDQYALEAPLNYVPIVLGVAGVAIGMLGLVTLTRKRK